MFCLLTPFSVQMDARQPARDFILGQVIVRRVANQVKGRHCARIVSEMTNSFSASLRALSNFCLDEPPFNVKVRRNRWSGSIQRPVRLMNYGNRNTRTENQSASPRHHGGRSGASALALSQRVGG